MSGTNRPAVSACDNANNADPDQLRAGEMRAGDQFAQMCWPDARGACGWSGAKFKDKLAGFRRRDYHQIGTVVAFAWRQTGGAKDHAGCSFLSRKRGNLVDQRSCVHDL